MKGADGYPLSSPAPGRLCQRDEPGSPLTYLPHHSFPSPLGAGRAAPSRGGLTPHASTVHQIIPLSKDHAQAPSPRRLPVGIIHDVCAVSNTRLCMMVLYCTVLYTTVPVFFACSDRPAHRP